ncbi:MAG TPA: DUF222 domain-containing protein, partial [Mycobacterium sp.]|nr:DUF222 domain-containing protein [Mycobacterium sp.]
MSERQCIPVGLAEMAPGAELGAVLETLDVARLNGHDLVVVLAARARQVAHLQAGMYAAMAAIAHCPPGDADSPVARTDGQVEFAADEIRAALTWTRRKADTELGLALRLAGELSPTWRYLHEGKIDVGRVWVINNATSVLDEHQDAAALGDVQDKVLDYATTHTTGQVAAKLRRLVITADPEAAKKRYDDGVKDRRVGTQLNDDGTGNLYGINLPTDRAAMARARIEAFAKAARLGGDTRTLEQLRADVYLDLLCGTSSRDRGEGGGPTPTNSGAIVQLTVPISTLMGLAETPGDLAGWGPVIADVARQFVRDQTTGQWRWIVTDPDTGQVLGADLTRRRPTAAQRRRAQAQSPRCRFVGCRMPAAHSDIDHIVRYTDGGPTDNDNLGPLCRHDHRLKDQGGWKLHLPRPGVAQWTSP